MSNDGALLAVGTIGKRAAVGNRVVKRRLTKHGQIG